MIITLCGSTKFKKEFEEENKRLTLEGNLVLSVGLFNHADDLEISKEEKLLVDKIHLQKINLSDAIHVIDVDRYVGDSTKNEIVHASREGKKITYYSKI